MTRASAQRLVGVIVIVGCLIALLQFGVRSSFGLFLAPMSSDLGWGREVFAFALAIQNLIWGLGQPFAGALADRFGTARVLAIGAGVYVIGIVLMAFPSSPLMFHLSAGVLVGLGLAGSSFTLVLAAFARLVAEEKRSWALGMGTAAGSLGQFLMVPLGQAFLTAYGWSVALILLSMFSLLIIPMATVLRGKPDDYAVGMRKQSLTQALHEAGGHASYWYLIAGFFVCGFHVTFMIVHLPAYLTDNGLTPQLAAVALALVGLFNVLGAYLAGVMGGSYQKKSLLSWIYLGRAVVILLFIMVPLSNMTTLLFVGFMGLFWLSTVPLTSGLVLVMFGPRYMGTLLGIVFFSHQIGSFLGVWLGGLLFDATGSYDVVWWISIALGILAALIHWPIREQSVEERLALAS